MDDAQVNSKQGRTGGLLGCQRERKLSRRDWILLPVISLLTMGLIAVSTEWTARRMLSGSKTAVTNCMVLNDSSTGAKGIPNTVCWEKDLETALIEYRFNSCGHRAGMECGPKPPGTYRIVMTGSSIAMGMMVPREESLAALLPPELSRQTGRKIELYNEGLALGVPLGVTLRFNDVLAARPDMIFWVLAPWDINHVSLNMPAPVLPTRPGFLGMTRYRVREALATKSLPDAIPDIMATLRDLLETTQAGYLLRHMLYESQSAYVKAFLMQGDPAGFLRITPSAEWQGRLQEFDRYAADVEERARAAGVPFVAVMVPDRAQAAMISLGEWPAGYDPYKLNEELRSIITSHGGIYIDILPGFRNIPNPEQYYLPVDGHPNAQGHRIISGLLAKELTRGAGPSLGVAASPQTGFDHGR